jgi:hypothetical protein
VNSCFNCPDVELMATRSLAARAPKNLPAELRTNRASCIDMCTSSKTMETNRCGRVAAFSAAGSTFDEAPSAATEARRVSLRAASVSTLKEEIVWSFRLSTSWKSSFLRFGTTLPLASRTTTRTSTRFTRTLNVVGVSRLATS